MKFGLLKQKSLLALYVLSVLQVSALFAAGQSNELGQLFGILLAWVLGLAAVATLFANKNLASASLLSVILLALISRAIAASAMPLLEDDYFRYLWDGKQTVEQFAPYLHAPFYYFDDEYIEPEWIDILYSINYPEIPTIYGPTLQYLFAVSHLISPGKIGAFQAILLVIDMAILLLMAWQRLPKRALLLYALHPLVLQEGLASAHPDMLVGGLILGALIAWRKNASLIVGSLLGLALLTKVSALIVIPFFFVSPAHRLNFTWLVKVLLSFLSVILLLYLPFIVQAQNELAALKTFSTDWKFNPLFFELINVFFAEQARFISMAIILAVLAFLGLSFLRRYLFELPPVDLAFMFLLLFSPVINPWYAMWLIPSAIYLKRYCVALGLSVLSLAYLNTAVFFDAGIVDPSSGDDRFVVHWLAGIVQAFVLSAALAADVYRSYLERSREGGPIALSGSVPEKGVSNV